MSKAEKYLSSLYRHRIDYATNFEAAFFELHDWGVVDASSFWEN